MPRNIAQIEEISPEIYNRAGCQQNARLEAKLRRELGSEILDALADETTEDIVLNPDSMLWMKCTGAPFERIGTISSSQSASALNTIAAWRGTVLNHDRPILETELPIDGSRFEGITSPVVRNPVFAIRMRPRSIFSVADYEKSGILASYSKQGEKADRSEFLRLVRGFNHAEVLRAAIKARRNILVVGATGSGKTTLVNALLAEMAILTPADRIVSIEDTIELQCPASNYVDLRAVGSVSMLQCLRACMRLKPTRIVVGEVRGPEAHALLKAWNTGHPGGVATVHANSAIGGLVRLESLAAESTSAPQQNLIAEAVDLVVFIDQQHGLRRVREVMAVLGFRDGRYEVEYV